MSAYCLRLRKWRSATTRRAIVLHHTPRNFHQPNVANVATISAEMLRGGHRRRVSGLDCKHLDARLRQATEPAVRRRQTLGRLMNAAWFASTTRQEARCGIYSFKVEVVSILAGHPGRSGVSGRPESFPYIEFMPKPGQARGVQIDIGALRIGLRYPVEVGLVGDSRATLDALLPLLQHHADRSFLEKAQERMRDWRNLMVERGTRTDVPMKPQVVGYALNRALSDDAIVCSDSGTIATWVARQVNIRRGQMFSLSGNLATMANGFPYAIAAQVAYPDRQCVAFVGDGGFSMLMAELSTCVKYKLPVKIVVVKNNTLGQIKWEQMVFLRNPEFGVDLEPIDHVKLAEACCARGFHLEDPADAERIMGEALATPGPVVIEALVDPNEPPQPARITRDQALKFAESLVRGEPNRDKIALTAIGDRVRELI